MASRCRTMSLRRLLVVIRVLSVLVIIAVSGTAEYATLPRQRFTLARGRARGKTRRSGGLGMLS
jgi:hypothetical protein